MDQEGFVPGEPVRQGNVCSELLVALLRNPQHRAPLGTEECLPPTADVAQDKAAHQKFPVQLQAFLGSLLGADTPVPAGIFALRPFCRRAGRRLSLSSGQPEHTSALVEFGNFHWHSMETSGTEAGAWLCRQPNFQ